MQPNAVFGSYWEYVQVFLCCEPAAGNTLRLRFSGRRGFYEDILLLDQIKCLKGVWWMPRQQEAMKDVILCDKSGGGENTL